jgi:DMSO/TMAO reductase YedYZ molybdopterin-dependent catalytic subunit
MSSISEEPTVRLRVVGKVRERLSVSKRELQKFGMETFIHKKLNYAEV